MASLPKSRLRNLDLATLRSFISIEESGSMSKAAARLYLTQSAISMQIKRLEESLGLNLFDRSSKGMKLTPSGEQLKGYAKKILTINDEIWGKLTSPDYEGVVRLGVPDDIIYPNITEALKKFKRDFPRVQIKFTTSWSNILIEQFEAGEQDIILTTTTKTASSGVVVAEHPLVWFGANNGCVWQERPLPIGLSQLCVFKPLAIEALEAANIAWVNATTMVDCMVNAALVASDICITARLASTLQIGSGPIEHGGQLPALPDCTVVMHTQTTANHLTQALSDYILHEYA